MHLIFFLALILIIVFARGSSKFSQAASDRAVKNSRESVQQWISRNRLDPRVEGYHVNSYVKNPDNKEAILEEVKECYDAIFELKPFRQICPPQTWSNPNAIESVVERSFRLNSNRAALILCAKRGYAYEVGWDPIGSFPCELDKEVMKWCCEELRKQKKDIRIIIAFQYIDRERKLRYPGKWRWAPANCQPSEIFFDDVFEEVPRFGA